MNSSDNTGSNSWFWGVVLSIVFHGIVALLVILWGFGPSRQSDEPQSIEGRLISPSELEGEVPKEDIETPLPVKTKAQEEVKKVAVKEPPPIQEEKPKKEEVKVSRPKKEEPPAEPKKETPKKAEVAKKEEPPEVKEQPKEKEVVVLEPKEEEKKEVVKEEEKQPVEEREAEEKEEPSFEDKRSKLLEEMRKTVVLKDIQKSVEERVEEAEEDSSDEAASTGNNSTEQPASRSGGAVSPVIIRLYINRIREEISNNWGLPPTIPRDGTLEAVVVFRVDENGRVSNVEVEDSSGNPAFDDFCVQAIYKASPLTPPPPELREEARTEGVEVPFTNEAT